MDHPTNMITSHQLTSPKGLDGLRAAINSSYHGHMLNVINIIQQSAAHLRDLAACGHVPHTRTPIVTTYLHLVLPCISRTLRDITTGYDDKTMSRELRWKKMYQDMTKEADGLVLPHRFLIYNQFLALLFYYLTRDHKFDPSQLEQLRAKILALRRLRGIPDPTAQQALTIPTAAALPAVLITAPPPASNHPQQQRHLVVPRHEQQQPHWCERVFQLVAARTGGARTERAVLSSPLLVPRTSPRRPTARRTLMRRSFGGGFFVNFILAGPNEEPCAVLRKCDKDGEGVMVAWAWHDRLVARRAHNTVLLIRRSESRGGWMEWARLGFADWEGERSLAGVAGPFFPLRTRCGTSPAL